MTSRLQIEISEKAPNNVRPGGNWHPGDLEFFNSEKAMGKVRRNLDATDHNFNLTVIYGNIHDGRLLAFEQPVYDDCINMVYCNNVSTKDNWIPMTSWILLHRLSHAMVVGECDGVFDDSFTRLDGPEFALFAGLDDLWVDAYYGAESTQIPVRIVQNHCSIRSTQPMRSKTFDRGFSCMDGGIDTYRIGLMATFFMTMKSARDRALSNELDIFAEAFAQFLHTGRFRMNRWKESGIEEMLHTDAMRKSPRSQTEWGLGLKQDLTARVTAVELLDQRIEEIEQEVNTKMATLAQRMVGKQFSF